MADLTGMLQAAAGAAGGDEIVPIGVDYDGSADYLSRATDLTGNSDGKTFTFSAWLYPTVQPSSGFFFDIADPVGGVSNPNRFTLRTASNDLFIQVSTSPYETIVLSATISASLPNDTFSNVLVSCDMANVANRYVYINDVAASVTWTTYADLNIPFTGGAGGTRFGIGATAAGSANYKGRISGLYLDYTYRDLSIEANRRLFIDDDGLYVTPPTTGIISVPMDDPADPGRNDGTGGNFTLNGVVARSGRGPNEYNAAASTFDGSADYLSKASVTGLSGGNAFSVAFSFKRASLFQRPAFYDTETDKPKFLGATGNLPTGSAPLIYLPLYASSAGTNLGTGGDFTVNSGPYVGARGPSEFWADSAEFNGTTQYLQNRLPLV
jgi:hypothetical protein